MEVLRCQLFLYPGKTESRRIHFFQSVVRFRAVFFPNSCLWKDLCVKFDAVKGSIKYSFFVSISLDLQRFPVCRSWGAVFRIQYLCKSEHFVLWLSSFEESVSGRSCLDGLIPVKVQRHGRCLAWLDTETVLETFRTVVLRVLSFRTPLNSFLFFQWFLKEIDFVDTHRISYSTLQPSSEGSGIFLHQPSSSPRGLTARSDRFSV